MIVYSQIMTLGVSHPYPALAYDPEARVIFLAISANSEDGMAVSVPLNTVATRPNLFTDEGFSKQKEKFLHQMFSHRLPSPQQLVELQQIVQVPSRDDYVRAIEDHYGSYEGELTDEEE